MDFYLPFFVSYTYTDTKQLLVDMLYIFGKGTPRGIISSSSETNQFNSDPPSAESVAQSVTFVSYLHMYLSTYLFS